MADRAGVARVVLVHFRAELQERIDRICAARPGAVAGRPGLSIEVSAAEREASAAGAAADVEIDGRSPSDGLLGARIN